MKRLLALAVVVFALATPKAEAQPSAFILEPEDSAELASLLAEATEVQGICYGWHVSIDDQGSGAQVSDVGSNLGAGTTVQTEACPKFVVFAAQITYTSESSESEDYANFDVETNMAEAVEHRDLSRAGISNGRLLGENEDLAIIDAVSALPLIMAERGLAPPVPLEPNTEALPEGDGATGEHGSDWTRKNGTVLAVGIILLLIAIVWALLALLRPNWIVDLTGGFE